MNPHEAAAVLSAFQEADNYESLTWRVDLNGDGDVRLFALCSDFFHYATADCEEVEAGDVSLLAACLADLQKTGEEFYLAELFAARKRGMRPLPAACKDMEAATKALFDACSTEAERADVDQRDVAFWAHVAHIAREKEVMPSDAKSLRHAHLPWALWQGGRAGERPVTADNRVTALRFAIDAMAADGNLKAAQAGDVTATANVFYAWLEGPAVMVLVTDPTTYQQAAPEGPGTPTVKKGSTVQLTDIQQVTLSVAEVDSKQQPVTGDSLAWSVDNTAAVTLTPSADTYSCLVTAVADGTATVTVADNSVNPPLTATDVITVVSSAATGLVISEGTAEDQPAPAPAA